MGIQSFTVALPIMEEELARHDAGAAQMAR